MKMWMIKKPVIWVYHLKKLSEFENDILNNLQLADHFYLFIFSYICPGVSRVESRAQPDKQEVWRTTVSGLTIDALPSLNNFKDPLPIIFQHFQ